MFLYSHWLRLPISTRHAIAKEFNIPKKGATEVVSNEVVRDGFNIQDIEAALNVQALQKYVGTKLTDVHVLWENMVLKAQGKELAIAPQKQEPIEDIKRLPDGSIITPTEPPKPPITAQEQQKPKLEDMGIVIPKKRGRPPKPRA